MSSTSGINENDYESPGYEFMRSYKNMSNLYYKLVALNYHAEFCSTYKCPPIHKYYFSFPNKNLAEQRYIFACLCAWLIKEKCQMNLELQPEEYEDPDVVIGVIYEALRLFMSPDEESAAGKRDDKKNSIGFPPGRLKNGFGPEVIWTMNILADRALELKLESAPNDEENKLKITYVNKSSDKSQPSTSTPNYITIGQPFVGGGLTTRPLGSYQIDDKSLLFDEDDESRLRAEMSSDDTNDLNEEIDPEEWYSQVAKSAPVLESAQLVDDSSSSSTVDWQGYDKQITEFKKMLEECLKTSRPGLSDITDRIDRQMMLLYGREKFIQSNMESQINDFLKTWRNYAVEERRHNELLELVNISTDKFESHNGKLSDINSQIELRIKELNDGNKLREFERLLEQLKEQDAELKLKIGLLLTVYSKMQANIIELNLGQQL